MSTAKILYWENLRPWSCQIYIAPKNGSWHSHTPPLNNTLDLLRICWLPSIFTPMFLWTFARCSRKRRRFMGFRQGPHSFRALTSEWLGWDDLMTHDAWWSRLKCGTPQWKLAMPNTVEGHSGLSFVTEGKATLHFAINNKVFPQYLRVEGDAFILFFFDICSWHDNSQDGEGVVEVSEYRWNNLKATGTSLRHHAYGEAAIPQCWYNPSNLNLSSMIVTWLRLLP